MTSELRAGAARTVITPPVGVDLCGYGGREGPSVGVHDDLRACALYLGRADREILILTADLIGLHHDEVAAVREGVRRLTGVPGERVMVSCSHTHAGPCTRCISYLGHHDEAYLSALMTKLAQVAAQAKAAARPAQAGSARVPVLVGINRRQISSGATILGVNEAGVTAPYADVLCVDDLQGAPLARLFCHAAHAVTLGGDNLLLSGDWPGYAQREVERHYGGDCVALYMQGCCGDINSHPRGSFGVAKQSGRVMAQAVVAADREASRNPAPALDAAVRPTQLPLLPPPPVQEAQRAYEEALARAEAARGKENRGTAMMLDGIARWAEQILALAQAAPQPRFVPFELQALRVGELAFVGLPGEVFVEYALNIDRASPFPCTAVPAYTNGNVGYVATAAAHREGGYELTGAIPFYGTTIPAPESEPLILEAAAEVLAALV